MFDFPLKVDSLESVPDELRVLYEPQADGSLTLIKTIADRMPPGQGASEALAKMRREAETARKKAQELEQKLKDVDPDDYQRLKAEHEERETKEAEKKGEWDRVKKQISDKHEREMTVLKDQLTKELETERAAKERYRKTFFDNLLQSEAITAIVEERGSPRLLLPHIKSRMQVVEEDDKFVLQVLTADGRPMLTSKGEASTARDLVRELKASDEFGRAFEGSGASGAGAVGATNGRVAPGENPWVKGQVNLTKQQDIVRANPERARQLAQLAGETPTW